MRLRPIFTFAALLAAGAASAQVYKWVDENGVVHFSDTPREGAELVDMPRNPPRAASAQRSAAPVAADEGGAVEEPAPFAYEQLEVASPGAEETLWNIEGVLSVNLAVQPALQPGHEVFVYFDGERRPVTGTAFQIEEVWRGVHNIQAEIVDQSGQLMIRSRTNRFYVQQNVVRQGPAAPR